MRVLHKGLLAVVGIVAATALLAWLCFYDPKVIFLEHRGPAQWIVFPAVPYPDAHNMVSLDTIFQRSFTLAKLPRSAQLKVRAADYFELTINGRPVDVHAGQNWKQTAMTDIAADLRSGTNSIEVQVWQDHGPPALWLSLALDEAMLNSDPTWEASCAGSAWRSAVCASTARMPGRGNPVAGGEGSLSALATVWPVWAAFGVLALGFRFMRGGWFDFNPVSDPLPVTRLTRDDIVRVTIIAIFWVALFCHNSPLLPPVTGFDSTAHAEYIHYLQRRHALPLVNEGAEMFQPPLYYGISALALSTFGLDTADPAAGSVFRVLGMSCSIAQFILVFLSLRILFADKAGPPRIGLLLAAFLPMQLYLSHYVTNEILAATLATATIYLCLRLLKTENPPVAQYSALGFCLGAACLAKMTNTLLIPVILTGLAARLAVQRRPLKAWLTTVGVTGIICFLVCGWFYVRTWIHFGSPLVGNWDAVSGYAWWQDNGYRTAGDYTRFGRSVFHPFFSGFAGLADGLFSTAWGDGLCGGAIDLTYRPPWNYSLMAAGYLLALVPTLLLLCGIIVALVRFFRQPTADRFILLGFLGIVVFGLLVMSLKVPSYAQAKAFYGLCALVPLCYCVGVGWEFLTGKSRSLQVVFGAILLVWAMNSFASVWIQSATAPAYLYRGIWVANTDNAAAMTEFLAATRTDPANAPARRLLARTLNRSDNAREAIREAERAVELDPADPVGHLFLGRILMELGQTEHAISEAQRAVELGPECTAARRDLAIWLVEAGRDIAAIDTARQGLAVSPDDSLLHYALGLALTRQGDVTASTNQLTYALLLRPVWEVPSEWEARVHLDYGLTLLQTGKGRESLEQLKESVRLAPDSPVALDYLAWVMATHPDAALRNGPEALRLIKRACSFAGENDPTLLGTLAAAYAEAGMFPSATETAQKALAAARSADDDRLTILSQEMLVLFQANRPYRQKPEERMPPPGLMQYRFR